MARDYTVRGRIVADDRATPEIRKAETAFQRLTNRISVGLVAATAVAGGAIGKFVSAIRSAIEAASQQELAIIRLDTALRSLGPAAEGVSRRLQDQAAALQQVTRFGDEAIIEGQALIASFTKNEEAIKSATIAALDLSSATGTDLRSAFLLLGRAAAGETSTLSRYGIILDESIPKSEKFAAALAKINEQFGGQAQAQAENYAGRVQQLSNAIGDAQEQIGAGITQNEAWNDSLVRTTETVQRAEPIFRAFGRVVGDSGASVVDFTRSLAGTQSLLEAFVNTAGIRVRSAFEGLRALIGSTAQSLLERFNPAMRTARAIADSVAEAAENAAGSVSDLGDASETASQQMTRSTEVLKELGLTADGVDASLEKQIALLEELDDLHRAGALSTEAFTAATQKVIVSLEGQEGSLKRVEDLYRSGAISVGVYEAALERLRIREESSVLSTDRATAALARKRAELLEVDGQARRTAEAVLFMSQTFDQLARQSGTNAAVSAAVAGGGDLVLGGTRINLPGGGSRLTRPPGLRNALAAGNF